MGFLSNLFSGFSKNDDDDEEELDEELEEEEDDEPAGMKDLREGMTLDVLTEKGRLLLSGKMTSYRGGTATLERLPGWLAFEVLPEGEEVSVRGYNRRMVQFNLTAAIKESSRVVCKLENLKVSTMENQRLSFRIPVNTPAWLYRQDDDRYLRPEPCTLVDVSTGGCCIESEYVHEENEVLRIKIKLEEYQPMQFLGQIIRASEAGDNQFRYGILFAQLHEDELTALTRTLYNIQVGNRQEWQRSANGHFH